MKKLTKKQLEKFSDATEFGWEFKPEISYDPNSDEYIYLYHGIEMHFSKAAVLQIISRYENSIEPLLPPKNWSAYIKRAKSHRTQQASK